MSDVLYDGLDPQITVVRSSGKKKVENQDGKKKRKEKEKEKDG